MSIESRSLPGPPARPGPPRRLVARILVTQLLLAALVGVAFVVCYAGLQRDPQPHAMPVAVVGRAESAQLQRALGDAVAVRAVPDRADAEAAVRTRSTVAAYALSRTRMQIFLAGPNGLAENGAAEALGAGYARRADIRAVTTDLVPLRRFDPRALASFYTALGVTVGSFILSQALYALRTIAGVRAQLLTAAAFGVVIGTVVAVVVGPVLQLVPVPVVALVPLLALLSVAVSTSARALTAWFDSYGITAATLLMTAVGLSLSGGILGPDLLPQPLGPIGAILPPGAALRALTDVGYFAGAGTAVPLLTLAGWTVVGVGGLALHHRLHRSPARQMR